MAKEGKLIVITGPMFAGKTTRLIKIIKKESKNKKVVLFRSEIDTRSGNNDVITHEGARMMATTLPEGEDCIKILKEAAEKFDVIGIDEAQFWRSTKGFSETINELSFKSKTVYVALLNIDATGRPFEVSKEIMPLADHVYYLHSKCSKCGGKASFTQRVINGIESFSTDFIVGGKDLYEARCKTHFVKPTDYQKPF